MKNEVAQCRHQIGIIAKLILETRREHTIIELKIKQKKVETNSIIKNCQVKLLLQINFSINTDKYKLLI